MVFLLFSISFPESAVSGIIPSGGTVVLSAAGADTEVPSVCNPAIVPSERHADVGSARRQFVIRRTTGCCVV